MGSGKNRLTLSYYKDTVRGILLALDKGSDGRDYILGGPNLTFNEIWQGVAAVLQKSPPGLHIPIPLLRAGVRLARAVTGKDALPPDFLDMVSKNWNYSSARAQAELGWQSLPFATALSETWTEYHKMYPATH
jgi:nucleoside-diphosphate-sugar epimerase